MVAPFLAINPADASPILKQYVGSTVGDIGVTFGTTDSGWSANQFRRAAVVQFRGVDTFYAVVGGVVYKTVDTGATWTSVRSLANIDPGNTDAVAGIFVCYDGNGVPSLCVLYCNASTETWYAETSLTGGAGTWSTVTGPVVGFYNINDVTVFRGTVYALVTIVGPATRLIAFSSTSGSITSSTPPAPTIGSYQHNGALASFNGSLCVYLMDTDGVTADHRIYQVNGAVWSLVATPLSGDTGFSAAQGRAAFFKDQASGNLILMTRRGSTGGLAALSMTTAFAVTNITTTVVPAGLQSGVPSTGRIVAVVDQVSNIGGNPVVGLYYASDGATSTAWAIYEWQGVGSVWSTIGSGGSAAHAIPALGWSEGNYFWSSNELHIELEGITPGISTLSVDFTLYSVSGSTSCNVRAWRGNNLATYAIVSATLTGTLTGLTADNGATTYTVTWQAATDGVMSGDAPLFLLEAYL